jgi:hypothetical protein
MENSVEQVQVFVRIKPDLNHDKCVQTIDDMSIRLVQPDNYNNSHKYRKDNDKIFSFDKIFKEENTQEDIYEHVSQHVKDTVSGYNTTVFAYGSTGSGKTYTMTGTNNNQGIIPRAINEIFSIIDDSTTISSQDIFFYVRISYVELYNNNFRNLLDFTNKEEKPSSVLNSFSSTSSLISPRFSYSSPKTVNSDRENSPFNSGEYSFSENNGIIGSKMNRFSPPNSPSPNLISGEFTPDTFYSTGSSRNRNIEKIEVRENQLSGVFLAGNNLRVAVTSADEAIQLLMKGNKYRSTRSTHCNDLSSRYV